MKNLIIFIAIVLMLFNGVLFNKFPMPSFFSYWDEALFIVLAILSLIKLIKINSLKIKKNCDSKIVLCSIVVVTIGLASNIIFGYAYSIGAIIRDIIGFLKFPITFVCFRFLEFDKVISKKYVSNLYKYINIVVYIIFIFGIISLFINIGMSQVSEIRHGINSYQFLFNHPNSLGIVIVMILCLQDSVVESEKINRIQVMCLIILILTMRTKIIAFSFVYVFSKYGHKWLKRYKILYILSAVIVAFLVSYKKLSVVMTWTESGRMSFWYRSFELLKNHFPMGTGFATFASHISGKYYSKLYDIYYIKEIFDSNGNPTAVLGDTGYPYYIAQFGVLGIIALFFLFMNIYLSWKKEGCEGRAETFLLLYILIALTGESTLLNVGVELGIVMSILIKNDFNMKNRRRLL